MLRDRMDPSHRPAVFDACLAAFLESYDADRRPRRAQELRRIFARHVTDTLGGMRLDGITALQLVPLIEEAARTAGPATAFNLRASLMVFFRWCAGNGLIAEEPVTGTPAVVVPRHLPVMTARDLAAIWQASAFDSPPVRTADAATARVLSWCCYYRLLLLLGPTRARLSTMRWADLDFANGIWLAPPKRENGGKVPFASFPLTVAATALLGEFRERRLALEGASAANDFVLVTGGGKPLADFKRTRLWIDGRILAHHPRMPLWSEVDVRRTIDRQMEQQGVSGQVRKRTLNTGIALQSASQAAMIDAGRAALEDWNTALLATVG